MEEQAQESVMAKRMKNLKFKAPLPQNVGKRDEVQTLLELNWTNKEIVEKTGCTTHYVDNRRHKFKRDAQRMAKKPRVLSGNKGKRTKVIELLEKGMTAVQIAKATGCTSNYASVIAWGIRKEKKKNELVQALLANGNSTENIAAVTGAKKKLKVKAPNENQIGGNHYKDTTIQVWDAIHDWGLGYFSGNVIKYVARHQKKNGLEDLKKARHYIDKLIAVWEAKLK